MPSDIAQTEQIVTEVNDRRLCGKAALLIVNLKNDHQLRRTRPHE